MTDLEVIEEFKQQISWGDKTSLLQHGDRTFLDAGVCLLIPTHWQAFLPEELTALRRFFKKPLAVLFWGNPPKDESIELCNRCLYLEKISAEFIDEVGRLAREQWIMRLLGDID